MKEEAGAGWGLIQGKRVASEPLENRRQNRWKTAGGHWQNRWKNRWKTAGKPLEKPLENRWKTVGRPLAKLPENRREKPRFWVTFASLNKGREWPERVSPASFFGPWGGLP